MICCVRGYHTPSSPTLKGWPRLQWYNFVSIRTLYPTENRILQNIWYIFLFTCVLSYLFLRISLFNMLYRLLWYRSDLSFFFVVLDFILKAFIFLPHVSHFYVIFQYLRLVCCTVDCPSCEGNFCNVML